MELLQSAVLLGVNHWGGTCSSSSKMGLKQVRKSNLFNAGAASSSSSSTSKKNADHFFFDDDGGYDSEEQRKRRREAKEKAAELGWAARARELAIKEMRSRNFSDRHFEALLPPHLRLSTQLRKKKKAQQVQQQQHKIQQRPPPSKPYSNDTRISNKRKNKQTFRNSDTEDDDDPHVEHEPVDPKQLRALAKKFNQPLNRALGRDNVEYEDEDDDINEPATKLSVVYSDRHENSDDEDDEQEKILSKKSLVEDPRRGFILNRDVVDARDVDEVLDAVARASTKFRLSPVNVSTALHRIAKHMVSLGMVETRRLIYARKPDVCELIASAMELLPKSSAQSVSNVAWALSKIGGSLLYYGEMEVVAEVAGEKIEEMSAQNVANIAGAFATMQHSSPVLFRKLAERGSRVAGELKPQELAQLLWSFACLNQPADCLLDALDRLPEKIGEAGATASDEVPEVEGVEVVKQEKFTFELLSNIAWSCAVLGQLQRPFFRRVCAEIAKFDEGASIEQYQRRHLTQLYQVMLALSKSKKNQQLISFGPTLEKFAAAAWDKEKGSRKKMSAFQREMQTFLAYTEKKWSREFENADYSLDFAVRDERVALEVNGPSHYARNTGELLGHTALKHRLLTASGWKVISASYADWEKLDGESEHIEFIHDLVAPYFPAQQRSELSA